MKAIRFINKQPTKSYTVFTLIAVILSILIFSGLNTYINKQVAYFLVTILSFFSIMSSIKKAGKEFEEIIIEKENFKFYFQNKMKEPMVALKSDISIIINNDVIEINNKISEKLIGRAYKNKLEKVEEWDELLLMLNNGNN